MRSEHFIRSLFIGAGSVIVAVCVAILAFGAVETTTIQGKVILANGAAATGGRIEATLSQVGTAPDTTTAASQVVGGRVTGTIASNGDVTLVLVPNDVLSPAGTFYDVRISTTGPTRATWSEKWTVDASPDPVDIGAIARIEVPPGIVVGAFLQYVSTAPSGACLANEAPRLTLDALTVCQCTAAVWVCNATSGVALGESPTWTGSHVFSRGQKIHVIQLNQDGLTVNGDSPRLAFNNDDLNETVALGITGTGDFYIQTDPNCPGGSTSSLLVDACGTSGNRDLHVPDGNIILEAAGSTVDGKDLDDVVLIGDSPTWTASHNFDVPDTNQAIRIRATSGTNSPSLNFETTTSTESVFVRSTAGSLQILGDGANTALTVAANAAGGARNLTVVDGSIILTAAGELVDGVDLDNVVEVQNAGAWTGKQTFAQFAITDTKAELTTGMVWGNDVEGTFDVYYEASFDLTITQTAISSSGRGIGMHSAAAAYTPDSNSNYYFSGLSMVGFAGYYAVAGEELIVGSAKHNGASADLGAGKLPQGHLFTGMMTPDGTIDIVTGHATKDIVNFIAGGIVQTKIDKDGFFDPLKGTAGTFSCPGGPPSAAGESICFDPDDPLGPAWKLLVGGQTLYVSVQSSHP